MAPVENTPVRVRRPLTANPSFLFVSIVVLATASIYLVSQPQALTVIRTIDEITALAFERLWGIFGIDIHVTGISVSVRIRDEIRNILIGFGCDGVEAYVILASAILPFPCSLLLKIGGLLAGLVFVFVINQIRLMGLILVLFLLREPTNFAFYHTVIGQIFALVMIFVFWSAWASRVITVEKRKKVENLQSQSQNPSS